MKSKTNLQISRFVAFDISELKQAEILAENSTHEADNDHTSAGFEDEIQNFLHARHKRELECPQENPKSEAEDLLRLEDVGPEFNEFVVNALDHFSSYAIKLRACRKKENNSDERVLEDLCSDDSQIIAKTLMNETADFIEHFEVAVLPSDTSEHQVRISWIPPKKPNGRVLHYVVKQKRVDIENGHEDLICISLYNRSNLCSQIIDKVKPGNYSFQIMASSLAGDVANYSNPKFVYLKSISHLGLITSPAFMALLFLIISSVIAVFVYKLYKRNQGPELVSNFENFDFEDHQMN
jgi:hypothetical protein